MSAKRRYNVKGAQSAKCRQLPRFDPLEIDVAVVQLRRGIARELFLAFDRMQRNFGCTQADLAVRLDCDPASVSRWLKGGNLEVDTIAKLAAALDHQVELRMLPFFDDEAAENPEGGDGHEEGWETGPAVSDLTTDRGWALR